MLCEQDKKPTIKTEIKCEDVESEDAPVTESKQENSVLTTKIKSDVEDCKPEVVPETLPAASAQTTQIPLATTTEGNKDILGGMQGYQPTANTTFGTLGLLPQTIPPIVATPTLFPYDNGGFLPHAISRIVPNQPFFCEQPTFTGGCFTAADILNTASTPIFLRQFQPAFQTRRRAQAVNCHENSQCVNCRTTNTSLWRRNEQGEVECNACNLYYRKNKRPRPLSLCKETISKRNRKPVVDRQTSS